MNQGTKLRLTIHNILYDVYNKNKNLDNLSIKKIINNHSRRDISFIYNICLNSMRYSFHTKKIMDLYVKKNLKVHNFLLLNSAITQIVYLGIKEYAVINSSVNLAKKLNIYHGFINSLLRKIAANKDKLKKINIEYSLLPNWFISNTKNFNQLDKKFFLNRFTDEPSLHLVFKNSDKLKSFNKDIYKTSDVSGFIKEKVTLEELSSFKNGDFWVQDFSSSMPLNNTIDEMMKSKSLDMCSAPGGKTFQMLSKNIKVVSNDKSRRRLSILNSNLKRLNLKGEIKNKNVLELNNEEKYDFIVLDAPCSAVGTIRRNPEIFYRNSEPDLEKLINLQEKMLEKASALVNSKGIILYMVCSFLEKETSLQIKKFLKKNNNYFLAKFHLKKENTRYRDFIKNKCLQLLPNEIDGFKIDGYFAAYLVRKD